MSLYDACAVKTRLITSRERERERENRLFVRHRNPETCPLFANDDRNQVARTRRIARGYFHFLTYHYYTYIHTYIEVDNRDYVKKKKKKKTRAHFDTARLQNRTAFVGEWESLESRVIWSGTVTNGPPRYHRFCNRASLPAPPALSSPLRVHSDS